jgi:hypothetical protein
MHLKNLRNTKVAYLAKLQLILKSIIMYKLSAMEAKEGRTIGWVEISGELLGENHQCLEF